MTTCELERKHLEWHTSWCDGNWSLWWWWPWVINVALSYVLCLLFKEVWRYIIIFFFLQDFQRKRMFKNNFQSDFSKALGRNLNEFCIHRRDMNRSPFLWCMCSRILVHSNRLLTKRILASMCLLRLQLSMTGKSAQFSVIISFCVFQACPQIKFISNLFVNFFHFLFQ